MAYRAQHRGRYGMPVSLADLPTGQRTAKRSGDEHIVDDGRNCPVFFLGSSLKLYLNSLGRVDHETELAPPVAVSVRFHGFDSN